ncbi:MAG: gas vesicle protein GvpN [Planctomycetota bacterium]
MDDDTVRPEPSEEFVATPQIQELTDRALAYLEADFPVHFAGTAGTGKTTLAFHVASQMGRPVSLIHGDDEFGSSDLIGRDAGYRKSKVVDNFIHSVLKTKEETKSFWVDNRLTTACEKGHTLIYDEFNRSRAEANNTLLTILAEKILNLPRLRATGDGYLQVHPDFRAIFTSNPEEYAGVHKTQDALMDRLITIHLGHYDRETEVRITTARSGVAREDAEVIVDIVRGLREVGVSNHRPTIRACVMIARVLAHRGARARLDDRDFLLISRDVLGRDTARVTHDGDSVMNDEVQEIIETVCNDRA